MLINEKIRLLRQQKGLSQNEMALKLKMSTHGYVNIELCHTNVSLSKLTQLAAIFDENLLPLFKGHNKNIINTMSNLQNG